MNHHLEIFEFVNNSELPTDAYGNCEFKAFIEYRSKVKNMGSITTVKIIRNGYEEGKIQLEENDELNIDDFHLDFVTQFQKYQYNKSSKKFTITGSSPKMKGSYSVTISPV